MYKIRVIEYFNGRPINEYEMLVNEKDLLTRKEIKEVLKGKNEGFKERIKIKNAYGEKKKELLQLIPMSFLKRQGINPIPGLVLKIGELEGIIKTVSGGRVVVDFNHPLAGKEIEFEIEVLKKFNDELEFFRELVNNLIKKNLLNEKDIEIKENKVLVEDKIFESIKELKNIYGLNIEIEKKNDKNGNKESKENTN